MYLKMNIRDEDRDYPLPTIVCISPIKRVSLINILKSKTVVSVGW